MKFCTSQLAKNPQTAKLLRTSQSRLLGPRPREKLLRRPPVGAPGPGPNHRATDQGPGRLKKKAASLWCFWVVYLGLFCACAFRNFHLANRTGGIPSLTSIKKQCQLCWGHFGHIFTPPRGSQNGFTRPLPSKLKQKNKRPLHASSHAPPPKQGGFT